MRKNPTSGAGSKQFNRITIRHNDGTVDYYRRYGMDDILYCLAEFEDLGISAQEIKKRLDRLKDEKEICREKVTMILRSLGVCRNYAGFELIITAVEIVSENPKKLKKLTKELYPETAKKCNTSTMAVERNIRNAAKTAYERDPQLMSELAGYALYKAPTSSEFIEMIYENVRERIETPIHFDFIEQEETNA